MSSLKILIIAGSYLSLHKIFVGCNMCNANLTVLKKYPIIAFINIKMAVSLIN